MKKVIVIDDESFILMMKEDKLKGAGIDVVTLRRQERPGLVILDWMMPEISGIEVCRNLKAEHDTSDVPILC